MKSRPADPIARILSLLVLAALLLSACGPATPRATPTTGEQTPTPTPAPTEPPTATPLPLPAPRLLYRNPAPGEEQPLDAPLELIFDQPMDRASVEDAFTLSPTVKGTFTWTDDRTVSYLPTAAPGGAGGGLQRATRYQVTIASTARNAQGTPLEEPATFDFSTVGYLAVSQVMPAPDSDDLGPDTIVTVVFDHPVVPLTALNRQGELPQPLTFVPPVQGEGEWLNTSIYQFHPRAGLLPATHYKARVAAGLAPVGQEAASGAILAEDYTWEFTTLHPAVLEVQPENKFQYLGPSDVISVTFNQPMDHASAEALFSLQAGGLTDPVQGTFRWTGGSTPVATETMVFAPAPSLPRDTEFAAKLASGARARAGSLTVEKDTVWSFFTVRNPGIVSTQPENGAEAVEPGDTIELRFASPMERQGFMDHLTLRPTVTQVYTYWSEYDTVLRLRFEQEPATAYSISLDASTPDRYGAPLGQVARFSFTTGDLPPYAALNIDGQMGAFSAYTDTVVYASHRNVSRLDVSLYRLTVQQFMALSSDWQAREQFAPDERDLVRAWAQRVTAPRNERHLARLDLVDGEGNPLPPGLYYLQLSAPEMATADRDYQPSSYTFVKSRLNLTLKQTRSEVLVWATNLSSGQPAAGRSIQLYTARYELAGAGSTGADGLYQADDLQTDSLWDAFFAITGQPGEEDFAIAYNAWEQGINPWDFGLESEFWSADYWGYLYTDRPIYRPGQTVYFKGIIRADDDARYSLPQQPASGSLTALDSVQVHIGDPQGKELYQHELSLNDMGTLHDELALDEQAALGIYFVEIQDPEHDFYASTSFQVAEYKKPEFSISVTTGEDAYLTGDTIDVTAEATYYFGGPVAGASAHWSVLSSDYYFQYECPLGTSCPWYSWGDYEWGSYEGESQYGDYGRLIAEGDAQTDDHGRVTFSLPADLAGKTRSQRFTLEVSVTDLNGQQVSNRTATIVHQGQFYIGLAPRGYLARAGEQKQVDFLTVDWDGEPVAGQELTVELMEHRWYSVRRQAEDGYYYWDWTTEDVPVLTTTVTTGSDGRAVAALTPQKGGSYKVLATGRDDHGNEIHSAAYFWVWGGEEYVSWRQESNNRIDLIADKDEYQVGDVAEILVPSPYSGTVQALVTVERGHIMESQVRSFETNSQVLRVPITEEHVPNVFISVVIVQGSEQAPGGLATFKMGTVKLPVSVASKELQITLTPDRDMAAGETYGPRQEAIYDLLVTDYQGHPVQAELSLRLADLAALALADESGSTLLDALWRSRGLGVKTSMPLVVSMEAYNRELQAGAKGGDGGEGGGLVRSQFADTAFWDPVVRTGEDGRAQVTVQLPDNLTTWRMQARGITADTRVGRAEVDVVSTLDLLVRPVLPRFFVAGDQAEIATIVHNNTTRALEVEVSVIADGLALKAGDSQTVRIPAGDLVKVTWPVEALPGEAATVHMSARASGSSAGSEQVLSDSREDTLPVYRFATPEVVATAGRLDGPGLCQEIVQLPPNLDPTQGELTVRLDGSLSAATADALDYLEHYPYECTEQTVSRFLPNVITWQALDEMGIERPQLRQELAQLVGVALQRLYAQQHYDGGWGWWVSDESDPYLTAYVVQGLVEAHRAGFLVDPDAMARAASYLREHLPSVSQVKTHSEANRLAYLLYVLAEYSQIPPDGGEGSSELGLAIRLFDKRHLLDQYAQATLAVALSFLEPEEPSRVDTLLADLAGNAVVSATGTHWEEAEPDYWNMNTDTRTTAIVIWALSRLQPEAEWLPGAVRWLMAARQEGYWESTQTTAWSLLGLVEYMRASGELEGDFSYSVYLDGEELASGDVSAETIDQSRQLQVEIARLLVGTGDTAFDGHRLVIERYAPQPGQTGEGQLYYTAHLRYYLPADHVLAQERGILVARQYSPATPAGDSATAGVTYVDTAQVGDVIQVKLTLVAPTDLHYVVVEDPLPAGFEGVDLSLKTTSVVGQAPELRNLTAEEENRWYRQVGWGWWWFSHSEMRDEKVVLFAQYLPRGTYEYTYLMRASVPGQFLVMPTTAYQMYFPEVYGRSDGGRFTVQPAD